MIIDLSLTLFQKFKQAGLDIIDFLDADILGEPLLYWLLGAGLIAYLTFRIIQATTIL